MRERAAMRQEEEDHQLALAVSRSLNEERRDAEREAAERKHVHVTMAENKLAVKVAGWMEWERRIQSRNLRWEDKHESRTHVDMHNSTWLMTRDEERDFKCVQFVLSEWQEGANKNQESDIRKQLEADKGKILLEDADPFHMYDLVEAEMFLRAGAVFKARSKLRKKALELVEQMEKHMEAEGESARLQSLVTEAEQRLVALEMECDGEARERATQGTWEREKGKGPSRPSWPAPPAP